MNTNERDERRGAPERIWCVNCGNQIYQSGGKWFHLSNAGMSCNVTAQATPPMPDAATRMREACVARVKEYLRHAKRIDIAPLIDDLQSLTLDQVEQKQ